MPDDPKIGPEHREAASMEDRASRFEQLREPRPQTNREIWQMMADFAEEQIAKHDRTEVLDRDKAAVEYPRLVVCGIIIQDGMILLEKRAPTGVNGLDGMRKHVIGQWGRRSALSLPNLSKERHMLSRLAVLILLAGSALAQTGPIPVSFFGLQAKPVMGTRPTIPFGACRLWDQSVSWAALNPSQGTYNWANLDAALADVKSEGVDDCEYTFGVVPAWSSSNSNSTGGACDFGSAGGCFLPADVAPDGTGSDAAFKTFVSAIVAHVNDPTYLKTHAHIREWEPWNEFYRDPTIDPLFANCLKGSGCSTTATIAQLVRMAQDVDTITKAADPNAITLTPSSKPTLDAIQVMQQFLSAGGAKFSQALAFHFYLTDPTTIPALIAMIRSGTGSALPLWSTEGSWGQNANLSDPNAQASFVWQYYLQMWAAGVQRVYWYEYENAGWGTLCAGIENCTLNRAGLAYQQMVPSLEGATVSEPSQGVWMLKMNKLGEQR